MRRKKTCPKCGQKKWLRDFYVDRYSPEIGDGSSLDTSSGATSIQES